MSVLLSSVSVANVSPYTFTREADEGSGGFKDGSYLIPYPREDNTEYEYRKSFSDYANYFKSIVSALTNPVFTKKPIRTGIDEDSLVDGFVNDATNSGVPLTTFMRRVARKARRAGVEFVIMDNFSQEEQPANVAEVKAMRKFPYIYSVSAEAVVKVTQDAFGGLESIIYKVASQDVNKPNYRKWTATETSLWEKFDTVKGELSGELGITTLTIGKIPVVAVYGSDSYESALPMPPLYHIARMNHTIFNSDSMTMELIRKCTYPLLAIPMNPGGQQSTITTGAGNAIAFDKSGSAPLWLEPAGSSLESIAASRATKVSEMYRIADLSSVTGVTDQKSGIAKEWDFRQLNDALKFLSEECENTEYRLLELFTLYTEEATDEIKIEYTRTFGVEDILADLLQTRAALDLAIGGEFDKQIKIATAEKMFRGDQEILTEIVDDIEAMKADEIHATAKDGTDGV